LGGLSTAAHASGDVLQEALGRGKKPEPKDTHGAQDAHGGQPAGAHGEQKAPTTPEEIWADLMEGNKRFVAGKPRARNLVPTRAELATSQPPRVIVLTCSDSRVSPTLIFDKSLGDLFVVRTAGNIADPVALGSIEYAAEHLHSMVLLVMGHEKCGAVAAALAGEKMPSPNLDAIVRKIAPAAEKAKACGDGDLVMSLAVEGNVRQSARDLLEQSQILAQEVAAKKVSIVRAVYRLKTGEVVRLT
jgi:carbonic anhydrase